MHMHVYHTRVSDLESFVVVVCRVLSTFCRQVSSKRGIHVEVVNVQTPLGGDLNGPLAAEHVLAERRKDDLVLGRVVRQLLAFDEERNGRHTLHQRQRHHATLIASVEESVQRLTEIGQRRDKRRRHKSKVQKRHPWHKGIVADARNPMW